MEQYLFSSNDLIHLFIMIMNWYIVRGKIYDIYSISIQRQCNTWTAVVVWNEE